MGGGWGRGGAVGGGAVGGGGGGGGGRGCCRVLGCDSSSVTVAGSRWLAGDLCVFLGGGGWREWGWGGDCLLVVAALAKSTKWQNSRIKNVRRQKHL